MKRFYLTLVMLATAGATFGNVTPAELPRGVCEYSFEHQITVWNGEVPSFHCYAVTKRNTCEARQSCPEAPEAQPAPCVFPSVTRMQRCMPLDE